MSLVVMIFTGMKISVILVFKVTEPETGCLANGIGCQDNPVYCVLSHWARNAKSRDVPTGDTTCTFSVHVSSAFLNIYM